MVSKPDRDLRPGSITDQTGEMVHITRFAGFHDEADLRPRTIAHQMMMDGCDAEKTRNRRPFFVHPAITQDQKLVPRLYRLGGLPAEIVNCCPESIRSLDTRKSI